MFPPSFVYQLSIFSGSSHKRNRRMKKVRFNLEPTIFLIESEKSNRFRNKFRKVVNVICAVYYLKRLSSKPRTSSSMNRHSNKSIGTCDSRSELVRARFRKAVNVVRTMIYWRKLTRENAVIFNDTVFLGALLDRALTFVKSIIFDGLINEQSESWFR
jgi:hypothetical protein